MSATPDDPAEREPTTVEIYEEYDWERQGRLRGTFYLVVYRGDGSIDGDPDPGPDYDSIDDEAYWDEDTEDYDWPALEARRAEVRRAAETLAQADPNRRLPINDAIARAHTYADRATIWLDNIPWVTRGPLRGRQQLWPPDDLDLRPRWDYEPPDPSRADAWWVRFSIEAHGLTPELAREATSALPRVLEVHTKDASGTSERRWWKPAASADHDQVVIECLIRGSDHVPVTESEDLHDALHALLPTWEPPMPLRVRLRWLLFHLAPRRARRSFSYTTTNLSTSVAVIRPATAAEIAAAARRRQTDSAE